MNLTIEFHLLLVELEKFLKSVSFPSYQCNNLYYSNFLSSALKHSTLQHKSISWIIVELLPRFKYTKQLTECGTEWRSSIVVVVVQPLTLLWKWAETEHEIWNHRGETDRHVKLSHAQVCMKIWLLCLCQFLLFSLCGQQCCNHCENLYSPSTPRHTVLCLVVEHSYIWKI